MQRRVTPALMSVKKGVGRGLAVLGAGAVVSSLTLAASRYQALKVGPAVPLGAHLLSVNHQAPTSHNNRRCDHCFTQLCPVEHDSMPASIGHHC